MNAEQLQKIFEKRFVLEDWIKVLRENLTVVKVNEPPVEIDISGNSMNAKAYELGELVTKDDQLIGIYKVDVEVKQLHRNKVGLRDLLKSVYKNDVDAALVVFVKNEKWRFSYISEVTVRNKETGKREQRKTDPKRYTYLLGEGEKAKTAADRFTNINQSEDLFGAGVTLKALEGAFSVEKMSKDFFNNYRKHYGKFLSELIGEDENAKYIKEPSNQFYRAFVGDDKNKKARDFVKKLLGRIVFLYFLEKKGWLGVPAGQEWGRGDENFLSNLFKDCIDKEAFYPLILQPLFFENLNEDRKDFLFNVDPTIFHKSDTKPAYNTLKIPFLNGGLFEKEDVKTSYLIFPGYLFADLFNFFDQYNFTVYEDSPHEHTVAVDPEMLGHIFENLLEDNKDKGAFYTPKEIVHYMCQESLIQYLCTQLSYGQNADLEEVKLGIEAFIRHQELGGIADKEVAILTALRNVKICDPAIGSGAFPMGMLLEIYHAVENLFSANGDTVERIWEMRGWEPAKVKSDIIQNSIYGVDIEPGAVDIARLRFWLSLVVDEEQPKPLPNLDYKITVGDSLLSRFEDQVIEIDWAPERKSTTSSNIVQIASQRRLLKKLFILQKMYFKAKGEEKSQSHLEIRNLKIDILINQLGMNKEQFLQKNPVKGGWSPTSKDDAYNQDAKDAVKSFDKSLRKLNEIKADPKFDLSFFDWKLNFPEILNEEFQDEVSREIFGFDILLGNPPYGAKISKDEKLIFKRLYEDVHMRTPDTFNYFISQSILLLKTDGVISFIVPNNLLFQNENTKTRSLLINANSLKRVINLGDNTFASADVPTCIFVALKKKVQNEYYIDYSDNRKELIKNINFYAVQKRLLNSEVKDVPDMVIGISGAGVKIMKAIEAKSYKIDDIALEVASGISTGGDKVFRIAKHFATDNNFEDELLRPVLVGGEIDKYKIQDKKFQVIYIARDTKIDDYPEIRKYLLDFRSKLETRSEAKMGLMPWYSMNRQRYPLLFEEQKIIMRQTSDSIRATIDNNGFYCIDSILVFKINPDFDVSYKYTLLLLNSKLNNFVYKNITQEEGRVFAQVKPQNVRKLFIPRISRQNQEVFNVLCDYLLFLHNDAHQPVNQRVDNKAIAHYIQQIADACVVELIYADDMISQKVNILEYVRREITSFGDLPWEVRRAREIFEAYQKWTEPNSEVRNRLKIISLMCPDTAGRILNANEED